MAISLGQYRSPQELYRIIENEADECEFIDLPPFEYPAVNTLIAKSRVLYGPFGELMVVLFVANNIGFGSDSIEHDIQITNYEFVNGWNWYNFNEDHPTVWSFSMRYTSTGPGDTNGTALSMGHLIVDNETAYNIYATYLSGNSRAGRTSETNAASAPIVANMEPFNVASVPEVGCGIIENRPFPKLKITYRAVNTVPSMYQTYNLNVLYMIPRAIIYQILSTNAPPPVDTCPEIENAERICVYRSNPVSGASSITKRKKKWQRKRKLRSIQCLSEETF